MGKEERLHVLNTCSHEETIHKKNASSQANDLYISFISQSFFPAGKSSIANRIGSRID